MTVRTVTVGDDLTIPAPVKVGDTNLPARLQDTALNATYAPAAGSAEYAPAAVGTPTTNNADALRMTAALKWGES